MSNNKFLCHQGLFNATNCREIRKNGKLLIVTVSKNISLNLVAFLSYKVFRIHYNTVSISRGSQMKKNFYDKSMRIDREHLHML